MPPKKYKPVMFEPKMIKEMEKLQKEMHLSSFSEIVRVLISEALETRKKEKK